MDNPSISSNRALLDQRIVHRCADVTSDSDELKISAIQYNDKLVSAFNLIGTMLHMNVRCSAVVYQRFLEFIKDAAGHDDFEKAAKVKAILWIEKYHDGCQWSMDEDRELWDKAVSLLLDRCTTALR